MRFYLKLFVLMLFLSYGGADKAFALEPAAVKVALLKVEQGGTDPNEKTLFLNVSTERDELGLIEVCILFNKCVSGREVLLSSNSVRTLKVSIVFQGEPMNEIELYVRYRDADGIIRRTRNQYVTLE